MLHLLFTCLSWDIGTIFHAGFGFRCQHLEQNGSAAFVQFRQCTEVTLALAEWLHSCVTTMVLIHVVLFSATSNVQSHQ